MKHLFLDSKNKNVYFNVIDESVKILKNGGVIVYPTDTLYGLGTNAFNIKAILKVFKIKKQPSNKPISVIVKDINMARRIACIDSKVERMLRNIWPSPITIILRKKEIIPYALTADTETIAIRIPDDNFAADIAKCLDFPITATSANISGKKDLLSPEDIVTTFTREKVRPDIFIDRGSIENPEPSTIIDLTSNIPKIVRIGVVGKKRMLELFKKFTL